MDKLNNMYVLHKSIVREVANGNYSSTQFVLNHPPPPLDTLPLTMKPCTTLIYSLHHKTWVVVAILPLMDTVYDQLKELSCFQVLISKTSL